MLRGICRETSYGISTYYYYNGDKLIGLSKMSTTYLVHDNQRGDIESITDVSNNIVSQSHFDPWGNQITHSGTLPQSFGYAGYYYDDETGLYYLKSRYYSPVLGRFLTRDGIGYVKKSDPQTLNLYSYAGNNPVSNVDPNGNVTLVGELKEGATSLIAGALGLLGALIYANSSDAVKNLIDNFTGTNTNNDEQQTLIYRWGSYNNTNLSPKEKDALGLSFSLNKPTSGNYVVSSMELVNSTGVLVAINDSPGHVSILPVDATRMPEWIASRPSAAASPHEFTTTLKSISFPWKSR